MARARPLTRLARARPLTRLARARPLTRLALTRPLTRLMRFHSKSKILIASPVRMLSSSCDFDRHIIMLSSRLVRCRPARQHARLARTLYFTLTRLARTPFNTTGTHTPFNTTGTHTPFNTTDAISFEEHNHHCMLMLPSSCDFMLPNEDFGRMNKR